MDELEDDVSFDPSTFPALDPSSEDKERAAKAWRRKALNRNERYHLAHGELIATLGGRCAECGRRGEAQLAVDHVNGRGYEARKLSYVTRVRRYYEEYRSGVQLRVLCKKCNGWDGARRQARNR